MNRRRLGGTGLEVSEIAFGGVEIGMPYGIGIKSEVDMLTEHEAIRLLHNAVDKGINFFDTARLYGNSESIMGNAFAGMRDKVILCTKCRHFRNSNGQLFPDGQLRELITRSVRESLQALRTDYLDVFMLHQADAEILKNETIVSAFADLKEKGITRAIGASTYLPEETETVIASGTWDVVQLPFNLMDQRHQEHFARARENGIGIVVRSVLLKGLLSNRAKDLHPALTDVHRHIQLYQALLRPGVADLPTLAVNFALSFEAVSSVLVGIDRPEYLEQSVASADNTYMDEQQLREAQALAFPDPSFLNLPRWEKKGWLT